jgi:MFS family permease
MIFQSLCSFAYFNWGPTFFIRTYGWTPGQAGRVLGPMLLILGSAGMFAGGTLSDRWQQKRIHEAPLKVTALSAIGTGVPFVAAMFAHSSIVSLVFIAIGIAFVAMPIGSAYASVQYIFPNQMRGQVTAFLMFVLNFGGISLGGFLPGFFNNHLFHNEGAIGSSIALTIGSASLIQFILFTAIYGPYRRAYSEMHPVS